MAGIYVKDNGSWKLPKSIWINQLGTWRVCNNVYVKSGGAWREMMKTVTISGNQTNFNLHNYVGSPSQPLNLIVTIPANVTISSYDVLPRQGYFNSEKRWDIAPRTTAFTVGAFPSGSTVIINNNGYISGGGGFGGGGGYSLENGRSRSVTGGNGGNGGYGIVKNGSGYTCTIVNTGTIAGGGGGGGGGGAIATSTGSAQGGQVVMELELLATHLIKVKLDKEVKLELLLLLVVLILLHMVEMLELVEVMGKMVIVV